MEELPRTGLGEKGRLIALITTLMIAGFLGTSLFAFLAARSSIRESIERDSLPAVADYINEAFQKELVEPTFISSMMASDTFLHSWVSGGERDSGAIFRYLSEIQLRYGAFAAFFVSEHTRRYYEPGGILKVVEPDEPRDAWYFRVRSMVQPYEINLDPDMAHGDALTIFINYRVVDTEGAFLGAAGVGISVSALNRMVDALRLNHDTAVYFADADGRILIGAPYGVNAAARVQEDEALRAVAARAFASGGGSFRYVRDGTERLLLVKPLPEIGWMIFAERTQDAAMAEANRALLFNLIVFALIIGTVVIMTVMTIDRFQSRLERTASYDQLTGALNRISFSVMSDHAIKDARRTGEPLSVAMFDIDDFKRVNDMHGHPVGDQVLQLVVAGGRSGLRQSDPLCRWGGEEFVAILSSCDAAGAMAVAEKFRASATALCAAESGKTVTLSAGIATMRPGENFYSLIGRADEALLVAKRDGKNKAISAEI
ncbi:MAG TPA: sensor domain-containing diguanylate cyclase [bacterium]|nr:sensor domain-containing diguanylate cyclase [bacterium]